MVQAVGEDEAVGVTPEQCLGRGVVKRPALMHEAVMHYAVKHAVNCKAERDIPQRRRPQTACDEQARRDDAKPHAVEIIDFKSAFGVGVVAFMPFPATLPVHPIFVKQDREDFHADDSRDRDEDIDNHWAASRVFLR